MNALLIFNPAAGQGRPEEALAAAQLGLYSVPARGGRDPGAGDAEAAARRAAAHAATSSMPSSSPGGDGTLNEVVNGLSPKFPGTAAGRLPVGLIPLGTRNVLARELHVPRGDMAAQAAIFERGRTRALDLGRSGNRYFSLVAGFGFDAAVVREVALPMKELIGPAAYAFATLGALAKYRSTRFHLTLDGTAVDSEAFLVLVANVSSYAVQQMQAHATSPPPTTAGWTSASSSAPRPTGWASSPRSSRCWPAATCATRASATTAPAASRSSPTRPSRPSSTATSPA